ncbi:MAG: glycosyltransferase [Nanoarchaeota archaeon]|nr:glycosyltransferase [Nanoarchaeota archaeon]
MKFSIIIPARNEAGYLARTLKSIENQDYPDYETIVVANGCEDNTVEIASKYADKVFSLKEAGVSKARNYGARKAKGEVLVFLDADTELSIDTLKEMEKRSGSGFGVGTVKVKPSPAKLRYKLMMGLKNLVNYSGIYLWSAGIIYCRQSEFLGFDEKLHVKETSFFIHKMKKKGGFQFLKSSFVRTSMRRYEKWGTLRLILFFAGKWVKSIFSDVKGDRYPVIR